MSLLRLGVGLLGVAAWFIAVAALAARFLHTPRVSLATSLLDALVFTLFAGLWFASLGSGGWLLLFLVLGVLLEGPARYRYEPGPWTRERTVQLLVGVLRIVVAGGLLALIWSAEY